MLWGGNALVTGIVPDLSDFMFNPARLELCQCNRCGNGNEECTESIHLTRSHGSSWWSLDLNPVMCGLQAFFLATAHHPVLPNLFP
jgi:hypothetical protein